MMTLMPGRCRHCNCTELNACRLEDGDPCCWINGDRLVCSNPKCQVAEEKRKAKVLAEFEARKPKRLTSADVHKLICGRGKKKPKKGRAA